VSVHDWSKHVGMTYRSQWHDSHKAETEPVRGVPVLVMRDRAEWHEQEQDIQPRAKEEELEGGEPGGLSLCLEQFHDTSRKPLAAGRRHIAVEERGTV
jgi:hypothetical protein